MNKNFDCRYKRRLLGLIVASTSIFASCKEQHGRSKEPLASTLTPTSAKERQPPRSDMPAQTDDETAFSVNESDFADIAPKAIQLVSEKGIQAIPILYESYQGTQREQAIGIAMSRLVLRFDKATLLQQLGDLPSGEMKQMWIWQAISKGQPSSVTTLCKAIKNLDCHEDKKTAVNAYATNFPHGSAEDFNEAIHTIKTELGLDAQFTNAMALEILRSYTSGLIMDGVRSVASGVGQIPEEYRKPMVEISARALASSNRQGEAIDLARVLGSSPELAKQAYSSSFEIIGGRNPSSVEVFLSQVPGEFRTDSIHAFVIGWLNQDSLAASEWAAKQTGADLTAAAQAVVSHLSNRKPPESDIAPWRALIKKQTP